MVLINFKFCCHQNTFRVDNLNQSSNVSDMIQSLSQMDCKAAHAVFTVSAGLCIPKKTAATQSAYQNAVKQKVLA